MSETLNLTTQTNSLVNLQGPPMSLEQKAMEMRNAIDGIEQAICGLGTDGVSSGTFLNLPDTFDGCRDDMIITPRMSVGQVRQVCRAFDECNRIINSPEYMPANLSK